MTGLIGAAATLIALGAGCTQQPPVSVQTDTGAKVDVQVVPTPAPSTPPPEPPTPATMPPDGKSSYRDGTYTAKGDYTYHSGSEEVTVTLTLKNGVVVDSQFVGTPKVAISGNFMKMFADNYKPLVIGKNLDELNLGKVSGSSRTPMGFNDAVAKIKAQARA